MPMHAETPFVTHAPLVNRHATVVGAHFCVHAHGATPAAAGTAVNALAAAWPTPDVFSLVEFIGMDSAEWVTGWQVRGSTALLTADARVAGNSKALAEGREAGKWTRESQQERAA